MQKPKAFTLLELAIIAAVISILIFIAIPAFYGMRQETFAENARGDLKMLEVAINSYFKTSHKYPVETDYQTQLQNANPKILENILTDPFSPGGKSPYIYKPSAQRDANYFVVFSVGQNGRAEITGINNSTGTIEGTPLDDLYETNGVTLQ